MKFLLKWNIVLDENFLINDFCQTLYFGKSKILQSLKNIKNFKNLIISQHMF